MMDVGEPRAKKDAKAGGTEMETAWLRAALRALCTYVLCYGQVRAAIPVSAAKDSLREGPNNGVPAVLG